MKGNPELIDALNSLLESELTSINQYMVHAEMAEDWGYERLSENFKVRSITEMKHAERLIERILFLEGTPIVSRLGDINIGAEIPQQVNNDYALELDAIKEYNEAIVLAGKVLDLRHARHAAGDSLAGGPPSRRARGAAGPDRADDAAHVPVHAERALTEVHRFAARAAGSGRSRASAGRHERPWMRAGAAGQRPAAPAVPGLPAPTRPSPGALSAPRGPSCRRPS